MKKIYLYLILNDENTMFKIGKATNVANRISGWYFNFKTKKKNKYQGLEDDYKLDLEKSVAFYLEESIVDQIEKNLHSKYDKQNIKNIPDSKTGYTEWFKLEVFESVFNDIYESARNRDVDMNKAILKLDKKNRDKMAWGKFDKLDYTFKEFIQFPKVSMMSKIKNFFG